MIIDEEVKDKIHKRLRIRLSIYLVVSALVLGVSIFHVISDKASPVLSAVGFILGMIVGVVFSRMQKISWDHKASQAIATFDAVGIVFLIIYVLFEIYRNEIVEHFVSGPSVVAVSFALLAGIMYGRVLGIKGKIKEIFEEQGII